MAVCPGESDLKAFIVRQLILLDREKDAEIERSSLLISKCSQTVLEKRGLALGGLGVASLSVGLGGKSIVELERPSAYHPNPVFPPHTFRPGDLAQICVHISGKPSSKAKTSNEAPKPVEGVIYKVNDTRIVVAVSASERSENELDLPERCVLVKLANTVTHDRMRRAIEDLEKLLLHSESKNSENASLFRLNTLHRVLLGLSPPTLPTKDAFSLFFDDALNPSQVKAVKFALNAPEVACIHGPPGTGKTRVLVEVIRQLVYNPNKSSTSQEETFPKSKSILVCGASNLAVDNLVERLSIPPNTPVSYLPEGILDLSKSTDQKYSNKPLLPILLTRLGHPARVLSSLYNQTLDFQVQNSDETALVKDVKAEIEQLLGALSGKGYKKSSNTGLSGKSGDKEILTLKKGQRLKGGARKEAWNNVKELRKEYRKREGSVIKTILSKAHVVLATCHNAGSRQLQHTEFDIVIIDEATQAMEALCWIPVLKAKKLILAGDPMQLGPTIISEGNRRHKNKKPTAKTTATRNATVVDPVNDSDAMDDIDANLDSDVEIESISDGDEETVTTQETQTKHAHKKTTCILRPPRSLNKTLFSRIEDMYGSKLKLMLDVQYRMNAKIATFPSRTLYHSRLKSDESNCARLLRDLPNVNQDEDFEDVVGKGTEVIFYDTSGAEFWERSENQEDMQLVKGDEGSLCNENEAAVVKYWVDKLISAGVKASQISIITPYQAQSQLLSRLITEPGLEIGTADGMQGRENEAIILSLVRSNAEGQVGFLKEKRRLNVAMTRAKRHLCIVGDSGTISRGGGGYLKKWMKWLEREAEVRFAGDLLN